MATNQRADQKKMIARFQKKKFLNNLIWFSAVVLLILTVRELPISDMLPRIYAISFSAWTTLFFGIILYFADQKKN